jgi:ATP-dependent helicase/nuclease subunit B
MSLQFIAGPGGCGKSHYIFEKIIENSMNSPDERFYVIVPEQFSMETQRELAKLHPAHTLVNIDILSFNRLAYRVFEETGAGNTPILEDTGKILVLQKIISENKDSLKVLKGMLGKSGAAARLNSMLTEMAQYRVEPDDIDIENKNVSGLLKAKIEDLRLVRNKFSEYLQNKYLTMEEVPEALCRVIEKYKPLQGATVVFDGFTGFVPTQLLVIEKMLGMCKKVVVTVTVDKKAKLSAKSSLSNLFHMSHQMTEKLLKSAERAGVEILPEIWLEQGENGRFGTNRPLLFLENQLFRYEFKKFAKEQEAIFIGEAADAKQEAQAAAEIISNLVRTQNYRYRDFAFVTGDIEQYGAVARSIFEKNGIPCFIDQKQPVAGNPAVEFVRAAVEMAAEDFSYKSVFRWLKTGMTPLSASEINSMENYVLAAGIRGYSKYAAQWDKEFKTIGTEELKAVNSAREKFVGCVSAFKEDFKRRGGNVYTRTKALYRLIAESRIQEKCKEFEESFKAGGDLIRAGEFSQIYKAIMELLEKIVEIMGDEKASSELYRQLLEAAFTDIRLGLIPAKQDQVLIGDIERSRLSNIKVMFFAGLNDGIIPKAGGEAGILSQNERDALAKMDISLAPDVRENMYRQRLYLYMSLTKPSERLYLSYSRTGSGGEAASVSYLINTVKEMFPLLKVSDIENRSVSVRAETLSGREEILENGYENMSRRSPENEFLEIVSEYVNSADKKHRVDMLNMAARESCPKTVISEKTAKSIYGENVLYSPSRLEEFGKCQFRHFLDYALRLRERDIFDFSPADIGSVLHEAISLFCRRMQEMSWRDISDEERNAAADEAFKEAYGKNIFAAGSSYAFDLLNLGSINRRTAWAVYEQIKRGSFVPFGFEEKFVVGGVKGIIDRVDKCTLGDVDYMRIIDYKSGIEKFSLNEFYHGVQIQLPLYMTAACEMGRNKSRNKYVETAGLYYYSMSDSLVKVDSMDDEVDPEDVLKALRLGGVSVNDPEVLRLMDNSLAPGVESKIIPVGINKKLSKDGSLVISAKNSTLSAEDFYNLERYTKYQIKKSRELIAKGSALIDPKIVSKSDSCEYCSFRGVCRFDEKLSGYDKKTYPKEDDEVILEHILQELKDED